MIRTTWVYRNGRMVRKDRAAPRIARTAATQVISDTMPAMKHPSNGRMYDSKSRFRDETRARGLTEMGNDTQPMRRNVDLPPVREDIRRAISELGG